jgi:hypothetical protein
VNGSFIFIENGNSGTAMSSFNTGFLSNIIDTSTDTFNITNARLVMRGVGTCETSNSTVLQVLEYHSTAPGNTNVKTSFTVTDDGFNNGYYTWISPWFTLSNTTTPAVGVYVVSNNNGSAVRIGQTSIQFKL